MSTKIYNAYKVNGDFNYATLIAKQLQKDYTEYAKQILNSKAINRIVLNGAVEYFDASLTLYSYKNIILFQLHGSDIFNAFPSLELLKTFGKIEDYHYQNQTDSWFDLDKYDNKISDEKYEKAVINWEERREAWEYIFDNTRTPIESGFNIPLLTNKWEIIPKL